MSVLIDIKRTEKEYPNRQWVLINRGEILSFTASDTMNL